MWPFNKFQLYAPPSAPGTRFVGGSWIGHWHVTWPFAELYVTEEFLILQVDFLIKKQSYKFLKSQITSIERKRYFPVIAVGIQIRHLIATESEQVIFWCLGNKMSYLIQTLKEKGWGDLLRE